MNMLNILFGSKLRVKVLGWLMMHPDERYFVRQLTSILKEDATNVSRELAKLASSGILTSKSEGRQRYYQVNKACPIFVELRGLVLKTVGLAGVLRKAFGDQGIRCAFVFGSIAAGTEQAGSDVDLMIIGDIGLREVSRRLAGVSDWIGREINPHALSAAEFAKRRKAKEHFVSAVIESPRIWVKGSEDDLKAMGG